MPSLEIQRILSVLSGGALQMIEPEAAGKKMSLRNVVWRHGDSVEFVTEKT